IFPTISSSTIISSKTCGLYFGNNRSKTYLYTPVLKYSLYFLLLTIYNKLILSPLYYIFILYDREVIYYTYIRYFSKYSNKIFSIDSLLFILLILFLIKLELGILFKYQDICFLISRPPIFSSLNSLTKSKCLIFVLIISELAGGSWLFPSFNFLILSNIQGFPIAPLAIATPSQPVSSNILIASSGSNMSPFPIIGIFTDSLILDINFQSASPE